MTDILYISYYTPNSAFYSVTKKFIGLKDFTSKLLQLTSCNLHTRSNDKVLPIPAFNKNSKVNFYYSFLIHT